MYKIHTWDASWTVPLVCCCCYFAAVDRVRSPLPLLLSVVLVVGSRCKWLLWHCCDSVTLLTWFYYHVKLLTRTDMYSNLQQISYYTSKNQVVLALNHECTKLFRIHISLWNDAYLEVGPNLTVEYPWRNPQTARYRNKLLQLQLEVSES